MSNYGAVAIPKYSTHSRGIGISDQKRTAVNKVKRTKMTFRQRLRNWLFEEKESADEYGQDIAVSEDRFNSDGMRLQVYKGSGGFVVEVRNYDRKRDENKNSMYIITDEKDLGNELGKIITMESMR
jgi:hypothetical protein